MSININLHQAVSIQLGPIRSSGDKPGRTHWRSVFVTDEDGLTLEVTAYGTPQALEIRNVDQFGNAVALEHEAASLRQEGW